MPPVIVDQPWPPDAGEDLRRPDGSPLIDPATRRPFRVLNDQLVVWVSLAPQGLPSPAGLPLFPAVLDTGFTNTFLIQEAQAVGWMTVAVIARLPRSGYGLPVGTERVPGWRADLWLYPNVPGTRGPDPAGVPIRLDLPLGAWIIPDGSPARKEKPLLGLRLIARNGLTVHLDGLARTFGIDTP